ncbi:phage head closure protein [Segnochrobactraceae bacterium EtOH-i3]
MIGRLRHRATVARPVRTPDGGGGAETGWETVAAVWVSITALSAAEKEAAGRLDGVATHRVVMRFRDDIRGGMRLTRGNRTFRLLASHDPDGSRRFLIVTAEEEGR